MSNLTLFLLTVVIILVVAWLWPTEGADTEETLNAQDWRVQDLHDEDESNDQQNRAP